MRKPHTHITPTLAAALFVALATNSHGQARVVAQFDYKAGGFVHSNETVRWTAKQGTTLCLKNTEWLFENGALKTTGGFDGLGLWPEFETASNKTISAGVMAIKLEGPPKVRTAFLTAENTVRLANRPDGGEEGVFDAMGPSEGVQVWVSGLSEAQMPADVWVILSFKLPAEVPLWNANLFSHQGMWGRGFRGEVASVVLVGGGDVSLDAIKAMESAVARRYDIPGIPSATSVGISEAGAMGFSSFGLWKTLFIVN
jgi:hypothetical protein